MVPPKNGFLSLRLPIFGASHLQFFYTRGMAPGENKHSFVVVDAFPNLACRTAWCVFGIFPSQPIISGVLDI